MHQVQLWLVLVMVCCALSVTDGFSGRRQSASGFNGLAGKYVRKTRLRRELRYGNAVAEYKTRVPVLFKIFTNRKQHKPPFIPVFGAPVTQPVAEVPVAVKIFGITRLPPIMEYVLQRVQTYFSNYVYEDLSRPPTYDRPQQVMDTLAQNIINATVETFASHPDDSSKSNATKNVTTISMVLDKNNITILTSNPIVLSNYTNGSSVFLMYTNMANTTLTPLVPNQTHISENLIEKPPSSETDSNTGFMNNITHISFISNGQINGTASMVVITKH